MFIDFLKTYLPPSTGKFDISGKELRAIGLYRQNQRRNEGSGGDWSALLNTALRIHKTISGEVPCHSGIPAHRGIFQARRRNGKGGLTPRIHSVTAVQTPGSHKKPNFVRTIDYSTLKVNFIHSSRLFPLSQTGYFYCPFEQREAALLG